MDNLKKRVFVASAKLMVLAALVILVPVIVVIDAIVIGHGTPEISFTEFVQEGLLLFSTILIGIAAWQRPNSRGFLVLVAGLLGCMFIRENDGALDVINHGFWIYPAIILAISAILYSLYCRGTVAAPFVDYAGTNSFSYLFIGLLIVLVFSRIFGTGGIWREVMGDNYHLSYKVIIQEGLELLGYVVLFYGAVSLWWQPIAHFNNNLTTPTY